jgi:hypothetical protein
VRGGGGGGDGGDGEQKSPWAKEAAEPAIDPAALPSSHAPVRVEKSEPPPSAKEREPASSAAGAKPSEGGSKRGGVWIWAVAAGVAEMMAHALSKGPVVANAPGTRGHGGTDGDVGATLMEDFGVPAERMPAQGPATLATIKQAITERRGAVAFVDPHEFSPDRYPGSGCHAVVVTGVELDKDGNVTAVFINDTGSGECGKKVAAAAFGAALRNVPSHKDKGGTQLLVTKGPIW